MIIELPSDLNVYVSTNDDGTTKGAAKDACCAKDAAYSRECSTDGGEIGNCVNGPDTIHDLDLNKWAGSFKIYAVKP